MSYLHSENWRIGLASSSPMNVIQGVLKVLDLERYFDHVASAAALRFGKPHPEVYINTADALGVSPLQCIAIEDSVNGMLAAKSAQMKTVVVPESSDWESPRWVLADAQWRSLLELPDHALFKP